MSRHVSGWCLPNVPRSTVVPLFKKLILIFLTGKFFFCNTNQQEQKPQPEEDQHQENMNKERNSSLSPLPKTVMVMVQTIINVVNSEEFEAIDALKDCGMNPHEAVLQLLERGAFQEVKNRKQKEKKVPSHCTNDAAVSCSQCPGGASTRTRGRNFQVVNNKQQKMKEVPEHYIKDAAESSSHCPPSTSTLASCMPQPLRTQKNNTVNLGSALTQKSSLPLESISEYANAEIRFPCYRCTAFDPFTLRDLNEHNRKDHPLCKEKCGVCYNVFPSNKKLLEHQEALSHGFKVIKKQFRCIHCVKSKTYESVADLESHTRAAHGRYKYRCKLCKNLLETRLAVSVHKPDCSSANGVNGTEEDGESGSELDDLNDEKNVEESAEEEDEE